MYRFMITIILTSFSFFSIACGQNPVGEGKGDQPAAPLPGSPSEAGQVGVVLMAAPWWPNSEPATLPGGWLKHTADQAFTLPYGPSAVTINQGDNYFTFNGKIAIGFHGTYNPPAGM